MTKSSILSGRLAKGVAGPLAAATMALIATGAVQAQEGQIEEIVVTGTGTSIRGEAPVGQNLISITREAIEESGAVSVQQIMNDVPQITGFGNQAQGSYGSADGSGSFAPTIHSLGASASNSTLILVNGHRIPLTGTSHTLADPSIIPPAALERVEVLPDGASATYGSDAVAGVLNFITRTDVEGVEVSGQTGFADGYNTANLNLLTGYSWDEGSLTAAYAYSYRSSLANADRPNIRSDLTDEGGRNYAGFNCAPATISHMGTNFSAPYGISDIAEQNCDERPYSDLIPSELRHSMLVSWEHNYSDALWFQAETVFSRRVNHEDVSRGEEDVTVPNTNPFFVAPPNDPGATSVEAQWRGDGLLGRGAEDTGGQQVFYVNAQAEYDFGNGWFANVRALFGRDIATENSAGTLCGFCVNDAIDNTTTATALNVFGDAGSTAAGGATTSQSVLDYITDSRSEERTVQDINDIGIKIDGTLMSMPAGDLKVAFGANAIRYGIDQVERDPGATGSASQSSQTTDISINRTVDAVFGELLVPITQDIQLSGAIRYDDYSDFGSTTNPRVAVQWQVNDALRLRASWAESFVAPALTSRGEAGTGRTTESGWGSAPAFSTGFIPNDYGDDSTTAYLNWARANFPGSCTADGCFVNDGTIRGVWVTGGNDDLNPATGETWSVGFDLVDPEWLPGFRARITYYDALLNQMVTAPRLDAITSVAGLNSRLILMPSQAELEAATAGLPQGSSVPTVPGLPAGVATPFIWSFQQVNAFNIDSAGIDFELDYTWDTNMGTLTVAYGGNKKTRFDQQAGTGGPWIDFLNLDANTTFSSLEFLSTASVDWDYQNMSAKLSWKHANEYDKRGDPVQSTVDAYNTFDFHGSYSFEGAGLLSNGVEVFLDVSNIFDEDPPFYNTNGGYNSSDSSPLGRVTTLGFRTSF